MPFKDYEQVAAPPLELPIGGKVYTIKPLGIADGLKISGALRTPESAEGDDVPESMGNEEFFSLTLGDSYQQMIADNVPQDSVARSALTAWADHNDGRAVAEVMWETGSIPELMAAYTAAKTAELTDSTESPSTDEGPSTPSPASTRTTSSRKATQRAKPKAKKAAQSSGPSSSSSSP